MSEPLQWSNKRYAHCTILTDEVCTYHVPSRIVNKINKLIKNYISTNFFVTYIFLI